VEESKPSAERTCPCNDCAQSPDFAGTALAARNRTADSVQGAGK
jgi:hypothetical protein